jgi:hypothetical protein
MKTRITKRKVPRMPRLHGAPTRRLMLTFDLPEEGDEAHRALKALDWYLLACDMQRWLRDQRKHRDPNETWKTPADVIADAESYLYDAARDRGLDLE